MIDKARFILGIALLLTEALIAQLQMMAELLRLGKDAKVSALEFATRIEGILERSSKILDSINPTIALRTLVETTVKTKLCLLWRVGGGSDAGTRVLVGVYADQSMAELETKKRMKHFADHWEYEEVEVK